MNNKVYSLTGNGLQEITPVSLPKFSRLIHNSAEFGETPGAVIEEPNAKGSQKCVTLSNFNNYFFSIDRHIRPYSKKFGIGAYYLDDLSLADPNEVELNIQLAKKEQEKRQEISNKKIAADLLEIEELPSKFPYLTPIEFSSSKDSFRCAIENMRRELKHHFQNVKFSVRKERYGNINVSWVDGPTVSQVNDIVRKYKDHHSDQSGDYYDYNPSNFNKVFGGSDYVFTSREISEESLNTLLRWATLLFQNYRGNSSDSLYNCRNANELARNLFVHSPIYGEFTVIQTDKTCGLNSPEVFWKVNPIP